MTFIAEARTEREKGDVLGLNNCLAKLDEAINPLHKCNVNGAGDLGSLYFLQAQALCLRALSRYENYGGSREEPERMVFNIASKVTKSLKSSFRVAQFYYDQGERMLLIRKMTKDLNHACECPRAWSITFEEFILAPNINFICYLDSILQEATILGLIGDGRIALAALE
nr:hypothetical protein [Tanacetum cinerariifolium]